jgi:hypothetical protein
MRVRLAGCHVPADRRQRRRSLRWPAERGLTGFGPVRYIYRFLVDVYRRAIGHDYFRRRVAILDADAGHLHYLIQVDLDFGFLAGRELQNHRGILLSRAREYTICECAVRLPPIRSALAPTPPFASLSAWRFEPSVPPW